uniref:EF-hand domain-containing protein n=1 Tax=uncultured Altererythrobacter sp. TaxID=500840 RepID=UPI00262E9927|nr:EF-hand domain-containing protein [uncultured Altererythrobacter sp.]
MSRVILSLVLGLVMSTIGLYWWQGKAAVEIYAPPLPEPEEESQNPAELPISTPGEMTGPTPPEASELTREQRRFFRYDRNRDWRISRNEMLSTRSEGFRKLDVDGNNLLTFEEWAVTTAEKFDGADADGDGKLTTKEFATTAPKRSVRRSSCRC